jgi:hypothetical protein
MAVLNLLLPGYSHYMLLPDCLSHYFRLSIEEHSDPLIDFPYAAALRSNSSSENIETSFLFGVCDFLDTAASLLRVFPLSKSTVRELLRVLKSVRVHNPK